MMELFLFVCVLAIMIIGWMCAIKVVMQDSFPGGILDYATRILPPLYVINGTDFVDKLAIMMGVK